MRTAQSTLAAALGRVNPAFEAAAAGSQQYVLQDTLAGYAKVARAAGLPDMLAVAAGMGGVQWLAGLGQPLFGAECWA